MSAVILPLPAKLQRTAKRRLNKVDLAAAHRWMMTHRDDWDSAETDGRCYLSAKDAALQPRLNKLRGFKEPTVAVMRKDITEGRKRIEKRNQIKQWLLTQGADDTDLATEETALAFMFDRMHEHVEHKAPTPPLDGLAPPLTKIAVALPDEAPRRRNGDLNDPEARAFNASRMTMLEAFIRKQLGASPVKPKLYIVKSPAAAKPLD